MRRRQRRSDPGDTLGETVARIAKPYGRETKVKSLNQATGEQGIRANGVNGLDLTEAAPPDRVLAGGPLLVDCKTAAALIGVGISTFYAMDRSGELGPPGLRLRRRRLWPRQELDAWVQAQCPCRSRWLALREEKKGT